MDVQRQLEHWLTGSEEDIEAAALLLEKRKVRQGLFFAHLAVEKALKAHVTRVTAAVPPRTHNLLRLAELADITLSAQRRAFLARLQRYCLEGRYPDLPPVAPTWEQSQSELAEAQETRTWLASRLS